MRQGALSVDRVGLKVEYKDLLDAQGRQCVGASLVVGKLNLVDVWSKLLDNGPDLTALKACSRHTLHEGYNVENLDASCHDWHLSTFASALQDPDPVL